MSDILRKSDGETDDEHLARLEVASSLAGSKSVIYRATLATTIFHLKDRARKRRSAARPPVNAAGAPETKTKVETNLDRLRRELKALSEADRSALVDWVVSGMPDAPTA